MFMQSNRQLKQQIKVKEAISNLQSVRDEMKELYDELKGDIERLRKQIFMDLDNGEELDAEMNSYELQKTEEQRVFTSNVCSIINENLVDLKQTMGIKNVASVLRSIKDLGTLTMDDVRAVTNRPRYRNKALREAMLAATTKKGVKNNYMYAKMQEEYTKLKIQEAGEALENQNSSSHKTGN